MEAEARTRPTLTREQQRSVIIISGCLVLLAGLNCGWTGPVLPVLISAQALDVIEGGWLISLCSTGSIAGMAMARLVVKAIGPKTTLQVGSGLLCLGMVAVGLLGKGFGPLLSSFFVMGMGLGLTGVAGTLFLLRFCGDQAAVALNRLHLCFGAGALLGPLLASAALSTPSSYRAVFVAAGVAAAAIATCLHSLPEAPAETTTPDKAKTQFWKIPPVWFFALVLFIYIVLESGAATWLYTYLVKAGKLQPVFASISMSVLWSGMTLGRILSAELCKRVAPGKLILASMLLLSMSFSLLWWKPGEGVLTLLVVAALGLGLGPIYPNYLAVVHTSFPNLSQTVTPFMITFAALGAVAAPGCLGYILEMQGLPSVMLCLAAGSIAMTLCFGLLNQTLNRTGGEFVRGRSDNRLKDEL